MNGIITAGIGWIASGIVAGVVWHIALSRGISYPGMLGVSAFVLLIGVCILIFNKRIAKVRDSILASKAKKQ